VPKPLIVGRYFARERAAIDQLAADLEGVTARLTELEEEHGGEEGAFSELEKVNRASIAGRLKELEVEQRVATKSPPPGRVAATVAMAAEPASQFGEASEPDALKAWLDLSDQESALKKRLREAEADLDASALAQYPKLAEAALKTLVVDNKWLRKLDAAIRGEMDGISQALTARVKELAGRYEIALPEAEKLVAELGVRLSRHLERMGFDWK